MKKLFILMVLMAGCISAAVARQSDASDSASPDAAVAVDTAAAAADNAAGLGAKIEEGFEAKVEDALDETRKETEEEKLDIKETIFEHLGDGYGWEVPFNHHKRIPLPIIVWGKDGLHVFSSSRVTHGEVYQDGDAVFKIATEGDYKGKLVEIVDGKEYKPWDLSITKNVCAIFITCIIVILLVMQLARWHKKNPFKAPRKVTLKDKAAKFAPYLLTVFFFIFFMNLMGLIVVFPGGANVTGNIAVTMVLAIMTFILTNVFGTKVYWKEIFWPDVPIWLKFPLPIMQIIEVFGIFTKPAALTVRLFANMMGGHMIVLILTLLIFIFASMGAAVASGTAVISIAFSVFMLLIDVLVSFIQAYVFTMLSTIFISLAQAKHEDHGHRSKEPATEK